jgi:hypothetical protein
LDSLFFMGFPPRENSTADHLRWKRFIRLQTGAELDIVSAVTEIDQSTALAELERLLASAAFRGSKRSSDFLRFVVNSRLQGHPELLKERTVGVEVFGKPPDYDTSADAIVRVKANEVRKRLAQAYKDLGPAQEVEIDLPSGSYVPEFRPVTNGVMGAQSDPGGPSERLAWLYVLGGATLLVAFIAAALFWRGRSDLASDLFWRPFLQSEAEVLVCAANPTVYTPRGAEFRMDNENYVGVGDAMAMSRVTAFLGQRGKVAQVRSGTDTSFTDLKKSPAVLIGAFTNPWTMQLARGWRFVFVKDSSQRYIQDQLKPDQRWISVQTDPPSDFLIVSRVFESKSGQPVILAAGLGHYGTWAAGEFLTNANAMNDALRSAPSGWENRNLQLVLRVDVIGRTPGTPKVLVLHSW